jgi:hypothetical protein
MFIELSLIMRSINPNTKKAFVVSVAWTAIFFMIGTLLAILIPFPYCLIIFVAIIVAITEVIGNIATGGNWTGAAFNCNEQDGNDYADTTKRIVPYFCCANCGKKHSETFCSNCGSKVKRVAF